MTKQFWLRSTGLGVIVATNMGRAIDQVRQDPFRQGMAFAATR